MKIRRAKEEEIKELCEIEMSSGYHKKKFNFEPYLQGLFKENTEILCSEEKENLTVYITLSKNGEIGFLAVSKKFQGKGIANMLLKKVISSAKKKKLTKLFLDVRNDNFSAIRLYLKNGFMITRLYKKKIDSKEITKLRLEKQL
ncbi:MAG: GNAT family N-acetyltransferase [Nanoarchaeota archaeon]